MRRFGIFTIAFLLLLAAPLYAAEDAYDFVLKNGMKVIHLPGVDNDVVACKIFMPGTAMRQSKENAGSEKMLLSLMEKGSLKFPRQEMIRELDRMGSKVSSSTDKDRSSFDMLALKPFFSKTLEIFAAAYLNPELDPVEIENRRQRQLAAIRAKNDNPDQFLALLLNDEFYVGHPYLNDLDGSIESVKAITREKLKAYTQQLHALSDSFIVVVGSLDEKELRFQLERAFGELPRIDASVSALPPFTSSEKRIVASQRDIPTKYILAKFPAPTPSDPAYAPLKLGLKALTHRLWEAVRTKHGLAYAVFSGLGSSLANYGYLYVTTTEEAAAVAVIADQLQGMRDKELPPWELTATKSVYRTEYYMSVESNASQADFIAFGEIKLGDYTKRNYILDRISRCTSSQVREAMERWVKNPTTAVVGRTEDLDLDTIDFSVKTSAKAN